MNSPKKVNLFRVFFSHWLMNYRYRIGVSAIALGIGTSTLTFSHYFSNSQFFEAVPVFSSKSTIPKPLIAISLPQSDLTPIDSASSQIIAPYAITLQESTTGPTVKTKEIPESILMPQQQWSESIQISEFQPLSNPDSIA